MRLKSISVISDLSFRQMMSRRDWNLIDQTTVYVSIDNNNEVMFEGEKNITIYPNVYLIGKVKIGNNCVIKQNTTIENSEIGENCVIGPNAYIRDKSIIGDEAEIGFTAEIKKSYIGKRTKAKHHCYIGDAEIGDDVNFGAGSITCNFNGKEKHKTVIKDKAFVGSGVELIAPIEIGENSYIGAGSVIDGKNQGDIPADTLVYRRYPKLFEKSLISKKKGDSNDNDFDPFLTFGLEDVL